ncbi:MAG: 50S ribosomal protein L4 [Candidatus Moraniibacteriota bacterium]
MMKVAVKNLEGKEVGALELNPTLFDMPMNDALVHQVFVSLSNNLREPIAHTKNRGDRRGSGMKPWNQKGTGRARVGSRRTPLWKKGGVVHGPRNDRNFSTKVNRKMRQKAALIVLSEKVRRGMLVVVDSLILKEQKTKFYSQALSAFGCTGKSVAMAFSNRESGSRLAARNLDRVINMPVVNLSVYDLLNTQYIVMSKESIAELETRFKEWMTTDAAKEVKSSVSDAVVAKE